MPLTTAPREFRRHRIARSGAMGRCIAPGRATNGCGVLAAGAAGGFGFQSVFSITGRAGRLRHGLLAEDPASIHPGNPSSAQPMRHHTRVEAVGRRLRIASAAVGESRPVPRADQPRTDRGLPFSTLRCRRASLPVWPPNFVHERICDHEERNADQRLAAGGVPDRDC